MITAQSRLGHSSITAQVTAQSRLAVTILVTVSSRWAHGELTVNSPWAVKVAIFFLTGEQHSVQMSWGNGGGTHAGSPGDQQTREFGPWAARRSRAMMRANVLGHDELTKFPKSKHRPTVSYERMFRVMCLSFLSRDIGTENIPVVDFVHYLAAPVPWPRKYDHF